MDKEHVFLKPNIEITDIPDDGGFDTQNLKAMIDFFSDSNKSVCKIFGDSGSFKTALFNKVCEYFSDKVIVFKIKCFDGTTLDDIFLDILEDLKKFAQQKKVNFAKIETNSLSQRINNYLSHISSPAVILIDSLENIFDKENEIEKEEITDFINHLFSMSKFKIVLISKNLEFKDMGGFLQTNIEIKPYTKEQTGAYFEKLSVKTSEAELEKLFSYTKGKQKLIYVTSGIISTLKTDSSAIINEFSSKKTSFEDFITQKLLTFVPQKALNSLKILSLVNIGLSEKFLIDMNFFTKEQIRYMTEKYLISNEYGYVYVKDYTKNYLKKLIPHLQKVKIHKYWKDFYESQLPLKPNSRAVLISRNTMRSQIAYHSAFVQEIDQPVVSQTDVSLMGYINSDIAAWNQFGSDNERQEDKEAPQEKKQRPQMPESLKNKNEKFEKYELTKDELALMSLPIDLREQEKANAREKVNDAIRFHEENTKKQKISDLLSVARSLEAAHSFDSAYGLYINAIELKSDEEFEKYQPEILSRLAECAKKINKTTDAIDWYNKLVDFYASKKDTEHCDETRLEIAKIYKESYKINHARVIYENFVSNKESVSPQVLALSYIALAEMEEELSNIEKAVNYYKEAFKIQNITGSENEFAKAYFKYALILDDFNSTDSAFENYQKCIQIAKTPDVFVSSAYTNSAEILVEKGQIKEARENYRQGLKIDLQLSNYEGIYYISKKISETFQNSAPEKVLDWLLKSLSAAKRTKDKLYIFSAYLSIGDFYYNAANYEKALKSYKNAKMQVESDENGSENREITEKIRLTESKL